MGCDALPAGWIETMVKIDNDFTENELLEELASLAPPRRRPGGVTVAELTRKVGSPVTARRILFKQEKEGVLYSEMAIEGGHSMRVWYKKV